MLLSLTNIKKSFGQGDSRVEVIKGIDLSIEKGEFCVLLGPSGSGKSTLLNIIGGIDRADSGQIIIEDELMEKMTAKRLSQYRRKHLGYVFQLYNLIPNLTVRENIEVGAYLSDHALDVDELLDTLGLSAHQKKLPNQLSGGQQQRVAIARAIVNEPEVLLLDEPLAALDLKMRKDMQMELKEMHKSLGITFVYVTHDQEEALTLSDTIVVMSEGKIQQIGTPIDIYNEPINSFVADFIGESNILNGTMIHDKLVRFCGTEFECVDEGFGENVPVDVVIRPEDLYIFPVSDMAQLTGVVETSIFKGVHYEMTVLCGGYEFLVQDYHHFEVGVEVGLLVKPFDIHIMKKERVCNTFEGKMLDATHVEFLGCSFDCTPVENIEPDTNVKVEVDFDKVILQDNEEDGALTGEVKFILYKGDHYHLTVLSDWDENVFVDTNDVWDDGDRVGITIPPDAIRVVKITD